jgi:hypothetical protein
MREGIITMLVAFPAVRSRRKTHPVDVLAVALARVTLVL